MCVTRKQHDDQCNDARSDPKRRDDGDGLLLAMRLGAHAASMPAIDQHREAIRTAACALRSGHIAASGHARAATIAGMRIVQVLTVAAAAGVLASCGSSTSGISHDTVAAGDPDYALGALAAAHRASTGSENLPVSLRKALPNYRYRLSTNGALVSFSEAVVVGTVSKVQTGNGVIWRGDNNFTVGDYNDSRADTRSAYVTMTVDRALGAITPNTDQTVTFRVIAPPQADPQNFIEGLAGLQRIAVVLHNDPNAAESVALRPIFDDSMIGVIGADGSLTLPTFSGDVKTFEGNIDTEAALVAAARAPASTEHVTLP